MNKFSSLALIAISLFWLPMFSLAAEIPTIVDLQGRWAEIKYQLPADEQEKAFVVLLTDAVKARDEHSDEAPYWIWEGIIRSTYAGVKGGLGALGEVKAAKVSFEHAIQLAPEALDGSAYTSLGSLYYQVPGWPVGFGSDEKAKAMLLKGLSYNPEGIDSHYFYGDYLLNKKQYQQALAEFELALQAPPRPGRELADKGRKSEIELGIATAKKKLGMN